MRSLITALGLFILLSGDVSAQSADIRRQQFNVDKSALAIEGYDPVAYFTTGKAMEGKRDITIVQDGITYRFATIENRDAFKAAPVKYEPQYGGWCAYAMGAKGEKVEVDPQTFKIVSGKLYLFYNKYFNNTLKSWNKDEVRLRSSANQSWSKFIQVQSH
ncbi:YHS domain-containing (seleno)protein [Chitinophaga arvensicola]|uniref:YHS domain-containing protein n=1 Tax=Chitinophaga arvensicola TaxID=29529 RepID=A0A1I0SDS6_9BACT|nr:YHS domain-containing (seleno)protein [Chitinophaga arvensicola]SEW57235.1 hypothetical protein SAMN04488122_6698 [Chitinophaga arvensicola]